MGKCVFLETFKYHFIFFLEKSCVTFTKKIAFVLNLGGNHIFQKLSNFHLEKIRVLFLSSLSLGEKSVLCWSVLDVKGDRPYFP